MKERINNIMASGVFSVFAIFPFSAALAIEPPPDNAEPPSALLKKTAIASQERAKANESVPFLGLATASLPDMVADHLSLDSGTGVIIRTVCPDSPAEKAGLSVNDIILEINGTAVGNPEALSSAVRQHKPGDRLGISLIHKGKPSKVEATLSERPDDLSAFNEPNPMLDGIPKVHADRLRDMIEKNLGAFGEGDIGGGIFPDKNIEENLRMLRERMNRALENDAFSSPSEEGDGFGFQQNSTIRMMDDKGSIEIKTSNGKAVATVSDAKNETIWAGPWNTAEEKAAAPKDIRERIDKVHSANGKGFSFRFGKLLANPDTIDN